LAESIHGAEGEVLICFKILILATFRIIYTKRACALKFSCRDFSYLPVSAYSFGVFNRLIPLVNFLGRYPSLSAPAEG